MDYSPPHGQKHAPRSAMKCKCEVSRPSSLPRLYGSGPALTLCVLAQPHLHEKPLPPHWPLLALVLCNSSTGKGKYFSSLFESMAQPLWLGSSACSSSTSHGPIVSFFYLIIPRKMYLPFPADIFTALSSPYSYSLFSPLLNYMDYFACSCFAKCEV